MLHLFLTLSAEHCMVVSLSTAQNSHKLKRKFPIEIKNLMEAAQEIKLNIHTHHMTKVHGVRCTVIIMANATHTLLSPTNYFELQIQLC